MKAAHLYGIDYDGPHPSEDFDGPGCYEETASVVVPQTEVQLADLVYQELTQTVNPLSDRMFMGLIYIYKY